MKTRTRDLTGKALDWAVALALNPDLQYRESIHLLEYSTEAQCADVIIHVYDIEVRFNITNWTAVIHSDGTVESGPTREIAAMQCFAVSRLGEFTEVPDNLMF